MKITLRNNEITIDSIGELAFTKNRAAHELVGFDENRLDTQPSVQIKNTHTYAYYGGFRARLRCCWALWKWLRL